MAKDKYTFKKELSNDILNKKFSAEKDGYSPIEVDEFLDVIITAVSQNEATYFALLNEKESYLKSIESLKKELEEVKFNFGLFKQKFKYIKENDIINNAASVDLIRRVNQLEEFISSKGFDPNKIS
ncbi:MAG: DivIVA domain-containing protein [Bacilli bacterium]